MKDIVIIGGGIAGLYCGYKLKKIRPDLNFIILERDRRQETDEHVSAGRLGSQLFEGIWVSCGGGIGTANSKLLLELLDELKVPYKWFNVHQKTDNSDDAEWFRGVVDFLRTKCSENNGLSFQEFARHYLSYDDYTRLLYISGYRDYLDNDSYHALNYYGLKDNTNEFPAFSCKWGDLVSALYRVLEGSIRFDSEVQRLVYVDHMIAVHCKKNIYVTKTVICATAIDGLKQLFDNPEYQNIAGQSCVRLYAKVKDYTDINRVMSGFQLVKVKNMAQQMVTINPKNHIFMAIYCDNLNADMIRQYMSPTPENKNIVKQIIDEALQTYLHKPIPTEIMNMVGFYDPHSIHIFKPLKIPLEKFIKKIQFPKSRVMVVGEAVAKQHGWVENALESTEHLESFVEQWLGTTTT